MILKALLLQTQTQIEQLEESLFRQSEELVASQERRLSLEGELVEKEAGYRGEVLRLESVRDAMQDRAEKAEARLAEVELTVHQVVRHAQCGTVHQVAREAPTPDDTARDSLYELQREEERGCMREEMAFTSKALNELVQSNEDRRRRQSVVEDAVHTKQAERERQLRTECMQIKIRNAALQAELAQIRSQLKAAQDKINAGAGEAPAALVETRDGEASRLLVLFLFSQGVVRLGKRAISSYYYHIWTYKPRFSSHGTGSVRLGKRAGKCLAEWQVNMLSSWRERAMVVSLKALVQTFMDLDRRGVVTCLYGWYCNHRVETELARGHTQVGYF